MNNEDVAWVLRMPSDELIMTVETLNRVQAAIAAAKGIFPRVKQDTLTSANERASSGNPTLCDRKITIIPSELHLGMDTIVIRAKGIALVSVTFHS